MEIFQWLPAYTLGASTMFHDLGSSKTCCD